MQSFYRIHPFINHYPGFILPCNPFTGSILSLISIQDSSFHANLLQDPFFHATLPMIHPFTKLVPKLLQHVALWISFGNSFGIHLEIHFAVCVLPDPILNWYFPSSLYHKLWNKLYKIKSSILDLYHFVNLKLCHSIQPLSGGGEMDEISIWKRDVIGS